MQDYNGWFRSVMELVEIDVDDALALIRASAAPATVRLAEGDLDPEDALAYARLLLELGQPEMAEGLVYDVIAAEFGGEQAVA